MLSPRVSASELQSTLRSSKVCKPFVYNCFRKLPSLFLSFKLFFVAFVVCKNAQMENAQITHLIQRENKHSRDVDELG